MLKNVLRYSLGIGVIVIISAMALYGVSYWNYKNSPEYRAEEKMRKLERQYAEDPYGGDTPEETLRLFIEALKAGDTDLAAKYFVLDEQDKWKKDLARIKNEGLLDEMIKDLLDLDDKYQFGETSNRFIFETHSNNGELTLQADIASGPNGKWKIIDI